MTIRASAVGLLFVVLALPSPAKSQTGTRIAWTDASTLPLEGQGWTDVRSRYDRLPAKAKDVVRPPVWSLSTNSTGLSVRFKTSAKEIHARWTLRSDRLEMNHMPATGVSGLDLYGQDAKGWHYVATARPTQVPTNEVAIVRGLSGEEREYRLYLPLYNGVEKVEVGVPEPATITAARPIVQKPVVFYGTSITQGGCASRPGMVHSSILGRRLDVPAINLGFSGNGKSELELADLLAEIDASVYVLDSLPNLDVAMAAERVAPFVDSLRKKRPTTPIVLVENVIYAGSRFVASQTTKTTAVNKLLKEIYDQRRPNDPNLYYAPAANLLGDDGEATVDGTHPTDLGFLRMADALEPVLRRALKLPSPADETGFVTLFDGESLKGWHPHLGVPKAHIGGKWYVRDGLLYGDQDENEGGGFLATDGKYENFILRFDLWQDYPTDTGIFVRMGEDGKSHQITLDNRPEGQIGSIYLPWTQSRVLDNPDGARFFKQGEWNRAEVRVEGEPSRIRLWLNGDLVTDFQHTEATTKNVPKAGSIGLQIHPKTPNIIHWKAGNTIRYRNLRIKEI